MGSAEGRKWLAAAFGKVLPLQRAYGKTAAEIETLVEGFAWVLGDLTIDEVSHAFAVWLKTENQIPTPADIMRIVQPPNQEWKPDWALFVDLKERAARGDYLLSSEREYLEKCREYVVYGG